MLDLLGVKIDVVVVLLVKLDFVLVDVSISEILGSWLIFLLEILNIQEVLVLLEPTLLASKTKQTS